MKWAELIYNIPDYIPDWAGMGGITAVSRSYTTQRFLIV